MTERTLSDVEVSDAIRKPSFELQQAAIVAGYASVRDFILAECVEEIRALKTRVDWLEENETARSAADFQENLKKAVDYGHEAPAKAVTYGHTICSVCGAIPLGCIHYPRSNRA